MFFVCVCECVFTDLPHSNNSICNKDEKDDEGLDKGGDSFLTFLEHSQHLMDTKHMLVEFKLMTVLVYRLKFRKGRKPGVYKMSENSFDEFQECVGHF